MEKLQAGQPYLVVKNGARLTWWESDGPHCLCGVKTNLEIGAVIRYVGRRPGPGSDDVDYDFFENDDGRGAFWPNSWGSCDMTFLRPLPAGVVGVTVREDTV